jgi:hypothetical protein
MEYLKVTFVVLSSMLLGGFLAAQEQGKSPAAAVKESDWVTNDEKGVRVLVGYLSKEDDNTICFSLDALARMGDKTKTAFPSPIPAICSTLKKGSWVVKIEAARTLIDLNTELELAHKTLFEALAVDDSEVKFRLAKMASELVKPSLDWNGMFSCWGPGPRPMRPARPEFKMPAIKFLMAAMEDREPKVRYHAAQSLGRIGADAKTAVPVLLNALQDNEPEIRRVAAEAAKRIVIEAGAKAGVKEFEKANLDYLFK